MKKSRLLKILLIAPLFVGSISIASCGASTSEDAKSPFVHPIFESYNVRFFDHTGNNVLYETTLKEHENAVFEGESPVKESDTYFHYRFTGWDKDLNDITEKTDFYPIFEKSNRQYVVNFYDEDGNLLDSQIVNAGEEAVYNGPTPAKPSDNDWDYVFKGWSSTIDEVTSDLDLKPVFEQEVRKFHVSFTVDGKTIHTKRVEKGDVIGEYDGPTPTKPSKESPSGLYQTVYTFDRWNVNLNTTTVTDNLEVEAIFNETTKPSDRWDFGDIIGGGGGNTSGEDNKEEEEDNGIVYDYVFIGESESFAGYYLGVDESRDNYSLKYDGVKDITNNTGANKQTVEVSYVVPFEYKKITESTGTCTFTFPNGLGEVVFTFNMDASDRNVVNAINITKKASSDVSQYVENCEIELHSIITEHNVQLRKWLGRLGDQIPPDFNLYL